jgi:hypothetical protein
LALVETDILKPDREAAERDTIDGHLVLVLFCLGGAALALWLLARFPSAGPASPATVILAVLAVGAGLSVAGSLVETVAELGRYGIAFALLAIVLPSLTGAFWVSGCVLRTLAGMPGLRR